MQFVKGILYFRLLNGVITDLFYPDEIVPAVYDSFHNQHVAENRYGTHTDPLFAGYNEFATDGTVSGDGRVITFKEADDELLKSFLGKWGGRTTLREWFNELSLSKDLIESEKTRVESIIKSLTFG